jgi:hypothetical protein
MHLTGKWGISVQTIGVNQPHLNFPFQIGPTILCAEESTRSRSDFFSSDKGIMM